MHNYNIILTLPESKKKTEEFSSWPSECPRKLRCRNSEKLIEQYAKWMPHSDFIPM